VAISAILLLRSWHGLGKRLHQSHLIMYWLDVHGAFVPAVRTGGRRPLLRIRAQIRAGWSLLQVFYEMLKMGLGHGAVAVYLVSTSIGRPPVICRTSTHSARDVWLAVCSIASASPRCPCSCSCRPLLSLKVEQPDANWDSPKLRFIATGTTFCVALGLAWPRNSPQKGTKRRSAFSHAASERVARPAARDPLLTSRGEAASDCAGPQDHASI